MAAINREDLISINFNQDQDSFAAGTQEGFTIHTTIPLKGNFSRGKNLIQSILQK